MGTTDTAFERLCASPRPVDDPSACDFYHAMDVPGLGEVEGQWDLRPNVSAYLGRIPLTGRRVLDLGTADGFLTFHMEREGAEVVSYDLSEDHRWDVVPYARRPAGALGSGADGEWLATEDGYRSGIRRLNNAYWFCHRAFGSAARLVHGDVYSVPAGIGQVDVSVFGALLLHTRDPFAALASAAELTRDAVVVTEPRDRLSPPAAVSGLARRLPRRLYKPAMRFLPDARTGRHPDGWWRLSPEVVAAFLGVLGFERADVSFHTQLHRGRRRRMFTVVGHRTVP